MKKKSTYAPLLNWEAGNEIKPNLPGYPVYPASEDIYNKDHLAPDVDPEDLNAKKAANEPESGDPANEKDFNGDLSDIDLDVPGAELDDEREKTGNEDEENNYYSIGGDDHNDLDEDKLEAQ